MQRTDPQKLARIGGWLFIATFVTSIPAVLLYGPLLHHDGTYILGAGHDTRIEFGALLEVLVVIANIGTALAFYPVLKRQSQSLSLGYVASRTLESTVIVIGIVSVIAVVKLRRDLAGASGVDHASLVLGARQLIAVHNATFLLGPSFCAAFGNGILLGSLMYLSGLMPRKLALIGVIGGPLAFLAATGALLNLYDQNSSVQGLLTIPEIIWELSVGIYLVRYGFRKEGLDRLGLPSSGSAPLPAPAAAVAPAV